MDLSEFESSELDSINFSEIEKKLMEKPNRNLKRSFKKWLVLAQYFDKVLDFAGFKISIIKKIKKS